MKTEITLTILGAVVLVGDGADKVFLEVDKPYPCWPFTDSDTMLTLKFECAQGTGMAYVMKEFGVTPEKIVMGGYK